MTAALFRDPALRAPTADTHVLVVDDDAKLLQSLLRFLRMAGYRVTGAADAARGRAMLGLFRFDLVLLDVMLPGESGLQFARRLQAGRLAPVLLLSALGEAEHRVAGLRAGADDYLGKPFDPRELLLRVRGLLRRRDADSRPAGEVPGTLRLGGLLYDPERAELRDANGKVTPLSGSEAGLMRVLARNAGRVLHRQTLLTELQEGFDIAQPRIIDVRIARLRQKIEPAPATPRYLRTVRGSGYVLVPDRELASDWEEESQ